MSTVYDTPWGRLGKGQFMYHTCFRNGYMLIAERDQHVRSRWVGKINGVEIGVREKSLSDAKAALEVAVIYLCRGCNRPGVISSHECWEGTLCLECKTEGGPDVNGKCGRPDGKTTYACIKEYAHGGPCDGLTPFDDGWLSPEVPSMETTTITPEEYLAKLKQDSALQCCCVKGRTCDPCIARNLLFINRGRPHLLQGCSTWEEVVKKALDVGRRLGKSVEGLVSNEALREEYHDQ